MGEGVYRSRVSAEARRWYASPLHCWRRLGYAPQDVLLALLAAAVVFGTAVLERASASLPALAVLRVAVAAPLALRRRLPLATAVGCAAVVVVGGAVVPGWPGGLAAMVGFGSAGYHRVRGVWLVFLASVGWFVGYAMWTAAPVGASTITQTLVTGIAPASIGYALRLHRDRADQAERLHRAETGRAVAEERTRIAREVHDAVGHHLTAIRMQANAARHVPGDADGATRALQVIGEVSATALAEVRGLLETLRDQPGDSRAVLADLPALATRLSTPACTVTVTRDGATTGLPALVDHGGYRLAQESLTNAIRHSGATEIRVRIRQRTDGLTIEVADNGPGSPPRDLAKGGGIRGMEQRALLLGGTLRVSARNPHGWLVRASLPIRRGQS